MGVSKSGRYGRFKIFTATQTRKANNRPIYLQHVMHFVSLPMILCFAKKMEGESSMSKSKSKSKSKRKCERKEKRYRSIPLT